MAKLGRCSEHLRKTVVYMAVSSNTPREKLRGILTNAKSAGFGSMAADDFPSGKLREDFQAITAKLSTSSEPQWLVNIDAMSDEQATKVIEQICELSDDVSRALGGQDKST